MKNTNKKLFAIFFCLVLVVGALLAMTACNGEKEHEFGEWETVTAATCTTEGEEVRTCKHDGCEEKETRTIPALGHDEKTEVTTAATCTTDGVQTTTCKREGCNYSATATIPALGHDTATEVTTAATCTAEGVETTTCKRDGCDYRVTATIDKLAHTPDRETATCAAAKTCTTCGAILEAKTAHVYKETVTEPTCTTVGYTTVTCENCDYKNIKNTTQALGHNPGDAATCQTEQTCTRCNVVLNGKVAHEFTVETNRQAADCEHDGYITLKCAHCDETMQTMDGVRLGHDVGAWEESSRVRVEGETCVYTLTYVGTCSRCGEVHRTEEKTIHENNLVITTPATCTTPGEKTPTCMHCGATDTPVTYEDNNAHKWIESEEGNFLLKTCEYDSEHKIRQYTAKDQTEADIAGDAKDADSIQLKDAELALNDDLKGNLPEDAKLTAETLDEDLRNAALENVDENVKSKIGDNPIYNFGLTSGGSSIGFGPNGEITVTVPYTLGADEDPESIVIFYVNADGEIEGYPATYSKGYATFTTTHFSYYTVARLTPAERCQYYHHTYIEGDVPATCTTDGYTFKLCRRCGEYIREITEPAFGHDMDEGALTPATCVANGKIVYSCQNEGCTFHVENVIPKSGHNFAVDAATSRASTCTAAGLAHYVCQNEGCDAEYSVTLPVADHTIVSTTVPVTCTTDGYTQNTCSVCGFTYRTGERAALGHSMTETVVPATCTEDGYTLHACRSCDYAYRTDTVAKHHTFDIAEPTCGQGQTCTLCGAKGLPATGNHTMVNGVCSVCGQGCTHDYDEKVVAPTCTESGYTEKTCKVCGKVVRENYTAKLGHDYKNGACTRCDDKLDLTNLYYQINRSLMTEKYTFLAKNVKLVIIDPSIFGGGTVPDPDPSTDRYAMILSENDATEEVEPDISLELSGELYFGFDENGDLYGYVVATVKGTVDDDPGDVAVSAMIRGGKVYVAQKVETDNNPMDMVGVVDLAAAKNAVQPDGPSGTANMLLAYLPEILKWYEEEVLPVLLASNDSNADEIAEAVERFLTAFFKMEDRAEGGYTFTFDFDKLHALNDNLANLTVSELVDFYLGEGTYAEIKEAIPALLDMTVGDIFDAMEADGLSVDTLIDLVDSLIVRLKIRIDGVEITSLDMLLNLPPKEDGTPNTLKEMLKDEQLRSMVVSDLIIGMVNEQMSLNLTKETVLAMANDILDTLEDQSFYHYIVSMMIVSGDNTLADGDEEGTTDDPTTGMTEEELEAAIAATVAQMQDKVDMFIEAARSYVSFSFTTDERGVVQGATLNLNVDLTEKGIGSLIGEVSVVKGYHPTVDLDEAFKELEDLKINPHSADGEDDIILTFDEDGNLISIKDINGGNYIVESLIKDDNAGIREDYDAETGNITWIYPENIVIRYFAPTVEATYLTKDLMMWVMQKDCGDWRSVMQNYSAFESHYFVTEKKATFKAEDIKAFFKGEAQPVDIIANYAAAILASDYVRTTEQVKQQEVDEDTMQSLFHFYYTPYSSLTFCYNVTTNAVKARSSMHDTELSYKFEIEGGDCDDGVTYTYTCKNCNTVTSQYKRTGHNTSTKYVYASELGHKDCPMYITYEHCSVCEKDSGVEIRNAYTTETTDDAINAETTIYRCYNEDCTFVVEEHMAWEQTGCERTERYIYTIMSNTETIKEIKYTTVRINHTEEHTTYTLVDGATSCEDGVVIEHWCDACGFEEEDTIHGHYTYLLESYDLTKYGSKCGGTIEVWTCACGEEREWHNDIRCEMHYEQESELETGDCTDAYSLHCSVSEPMCAYVILFKTIESYDAENCTATYKQYAYLNWDKGNDGRFAKEIYVKRWTSPQHSWAEGKVDKDPEKRTITTTSECKYCDRKDITVYRYKTAEDYTNENWYERVYTTYYSEKDEMGTAVWTLTERQLPFDENDPQYEILSHWTYYRREEWQYRDGDRYYCEQGVELSEDDPCIYRVYEDNNGNRIDKGWESFHDAGWYDVYRLFEVVVDEAPASCTLPGRYALECRFCNTRINPFARGDVFNGTSGMASDYYYETSFAWVYDKDNVLPYNNRGNLYVSATSFDEDTMSFLICKGHSYVPNEDYSLYTCTTCGLKNHTGYDDVCILEDCSEGREDGFLAARYISLTNNRLMPHLSFVLTFTDEAGVTQTWVVYFGEGYEVIQGDNSTTVMENLFDGTEFDDSAYITYDESLIVINWAGVREFIEAHAGEMLKESLASDSAEISCRLNIVPEGGMMDLECAITFE